MLRSILLSLVFFGALPAVLVRPEVGVLLYSWISYMYPQNLTYGFMRGLPVAMIAGAVTFAAWLMSSGSKKMPPYALCWLMILMAVWITITEPFSYNRAGAYVEWLQDVKVIAFSLLTILIMQDRRKVTWLAWVIVASLGYFALRGGISTIIHGGHTRLFGPDGSIIMENNALALALLTVVPLLRYLQLQAQNRWIRRGLICGYPFFFLAVFGSYSRGAFLGLAAMLLYMSLKSRHRISLTLFVLIAFGAAFRFMPGQYTERLQTVETYQDDNSAEERLNHWYFALNFVRDHPFGGGFKLPNLPSLWKYSLTPESFIPNKGINVAHSIYFETLQSQGIPGFALFICIIWLAMHYCKLVVRRTRDRPDLYWLRDLAAMTQTSLVGYCVGGAFLSLEFYDLLWHLFSFSVICRAIAARELAKPPPVEEVPAASPAAGFRGAPVPARRAAAVGGPSQFRRVPGGETR